MDKTRAKKAIKEAAKLDGIDEKKYMKNLQEAIDAGFDNPDADVQAVWKNIPLEGDRPTPEEVICFLVKEVKRLNKERLH